MMKNSACERKTKNTQDCQKLKFYQIQINSNINQCFPKQFWCWSWLNGLDYSYIPFFVVYGKSPQGITQSCTSMSQPPQSCCPSGWAGGSAGFTHAKLVSLTSPCCRGWPAPMNTPQGQQHELGSDRCADFNAWSESDLVLIINFNSTHK